MSAADVTTLPAQPRFITVAEWLAKYGDAAGGAR